MPKKDVDDVLGGKDAWANADKAESMRFLSSLMKRDRHTITHATFDEARADIISTLPARRLPWYGSLLLSNANSKRR